MKIIFPNFNETHMDALQTERSIPGHGSMQTNRDANPSRGMQAAKAMDSGKAGVVMGTNSPLFGSGKMKKDEAKSFADFQNQAEYTDVSTQQDYMTLVSHTMSEEDYAKLSEDGFRFEQMDPKEAVTIVDKIKAELLKAGKEIAGFNDDMDVEALAEAVGSMALAQVLNQNFAQADITPDAELLNEVQAAWQMAADLPVPADGTYRYMIDNGLTPEIWNFYLAKSSGAESSVPRQSSYFAEEIQGYYSQSASTNPAENEEKVVRDLEKNIEKVSEEAHMEGEEGQTAAKWLLSQNLPLTAENMMQYKEMTSVTFPVAAEVFAKSVTNAILEGKAPIHANLTAGENIYEKALSLLERYRDVEEVRLHMTAEVNVKLLRSGFAIDTAPIEQVIEAVKQAEEEIANTYFPGNEDAVSKYELFEETNRFVKEIPDLPADVLGRVRVSDENAAGSVTPVADGRVSTSVVAATDTYGSTEVTNVSQLYAAGTAIKEQYEKAAQGYEALMTSPRADMGDSIKKAFANVDAILRDLGYDLTEENRKTMRILGYNRMEMTVENAQAVKQAEEIVRTTVEKMTPAAVLKMIRDGVNPLETSFEKLNQYFDSLPEEYEQTAESYSRFLYGLEQNKAITPEERESYIGIYRLIRQIEKGDSAAVGAVVNTGAQLQFATLLSAVRSSKLKSMDVKVSDSLGSLERLTARGESISDQIAKAFTKDVMDALTEVSETEITEEIEEQYRAASFEQMKEAAKAEEDAIAMLGRGQMPANAENLLAAQALLRDKKNPFDALEQADTDVMEVFTRAWEELAEKDNFVESYQDTLEQAESALQRASLMQADTSLEVKQLQLFHKQLTIAAGIAPTEEYVLPLYIGEELTKVHLTFEQGIDQKGMVRISVTGEEATGIEASLQVVNNEVTGFLQGSSAEEVMKLKTVSDIFSNYIKEDTSYRMDAQLPIVDTADKKDIGRRVARRISGAQDRLQSEAVGNKTQTPDNRELYRVAKLFLQAVKEAAV